MNRDALTLTTVILITVLALWIVPALALNPPTKVTETPFWTVVDQNVHKKGYTVSVSAATDLATAIGEALPTDSIGVEVTNLDATNVCYVQFDGTAATALNGYRLMPQTSMRCPGFKAALDKVNVFAAVAVDVGVITYTKAN